MWKSEVVTPWEFDEKRNVAMGDKSGMCMGKPRCRRGRQCGNPTKSEMSPAATSLVADSDCERKSVMSPVATSRKLGKTEMSPRATIRNVEILAEKRDIARGDKS